MECWVGFLFVSILMCLVYKILSIGDLGHKLEFIVAETYGEEVTSVQQTADLWTKNISVYIGPQETCEHEAFMAAAFNLPMISYVSSIFYNTCDIHYLICISCFEIIQIR